MPSSRLTSEPGRMKYSTGHQINPFTAMMSLKTTDKKCEILNFKSLKDFHHHHHHHKNVRLHGREKTENPRSCDQSCTRKSITVLPADYLLHCPAAAAPMTWHWWMTSQVGSPPWPPPPQAARGRSLSDKEVPECHRH